MAEPETIPNSQEPLYEIKKLTSPNSFKYKVKDLLLSIDLDNLLKLFFKKAIIFFLTLTKTRHCQVCVKRFSMIRQLVSSASPLP